MHFGAASPSSSSFQASTTTGSPRSSGCPSTRCVTAGFVVTAHHVYDDGLADVYELTPVDAEEYAGEGVEVGRHSEADAALEAAGDHGALNDRWVNFGMVADEYADRSVS